MVESGLISYCARQARDGTSKTPVGRLAEAAVCLLKLAAQMPKVGDVAVEQAVIELYPGFLEQRKGGPCPPPGQSLAFLTSTRKSEINSAQLRRRQSRLRQISEVMALDFLQSGRHSQALLAAQQSLVLAADIYHVNDLNLIPSYCLLAEVCIGLNKLREGEQYLQRANWVVQRNQDDANINAVKSTLYRALGLVEAAKGDNKEALRLFAEQVYYSSLVSGTESIQAANGYFNLANVLARQRANAQQTTSLYVKALECWYQIVRQESLQLNELQVGQTMNMLVTLLEELSSLVPDSADVIRARALLTAFLSRMNNPNATSERQKTLDIMNEKNIDDELAHTLLKV